MKLRENQVSLIYHLAQYQTLDYLSCLHLLNTDGTSGRTALSYAFRPLTKNGYIRRHKDGHVTILAKGRSMFPWVKPLVTLGGGESGVKRVNAISRTAMFLLAAGVSSTDAPDGQMCFVPSTCWRKIRNGILSTARFTGILFVGKHRLAVYDIGDGLMDWQLRAERSLFHHSYDDTEATGMLFICDDDKRVEVARRIIRVTMWYRKTLIDRNSTSKRDKPVIYSKAPIRLTSQYNHVYLTTPPLLKESINGIYQEEAVIARYQGKHPGCYERKNGDYEEWPYRHFISTATDLLKYVYFFSAVKSLAALREKSTAPHIHELQYALTLPGRDFPIVELYPDVKGSGAAVFHEC